MVNRSTIDRFSDRVENYVKYRPGYPGEVLTLFEERMNLTPDSVMADIGSGTGLSSRLFVENGNVVYGVEPNPAMRAAAEKYLAEFPNFKSVDGTAENTGLSDDSLDFVVAAQAFHWFDPERARTEFRRILREPGYVALIWNERRLDSTPFLREYEQFLLKYGSDYQAVRHENVTSEKLEHFFQGPFENASFVNIQVHDLVGLTGRALSASYMPSGTDPRYVEMINELTALFEKHAAQGKIEIIYDTNVYYSQV